MEGATGEADYVVSVMILKYVSQLDTGRTQVLCMVVRINKMINTHTRKVHKEIC